MITRICTRCGSDAIGWRVLAPVPNYHGRKECFACGSTGPFVVDTRTPALHRMTDRELADEVAAFCDEGGVGDGG